MVSWMEEHAKDGEGGKRIWRRKMEHVLMDGFVAIACHYSAYGNS